MGIGNEKLEHEEVRDWEGQDVLAKVDSESPDEPDGGSTTPTGVKEDVASDQSGLIAADVLEGGVIMPKLENATAKSVPYKRPGMSY